MRERMSSETVGCASPKRWSGFGQPVALHVADADAQQRLPSSRRRTANGIRGEAGYWSSGRPNRYFGITHAPRRAARYVARAVKLASTAMSIAELPIPSTTTCLSRKKSGSSPR